MAALSDQADEANRRGGGFLTRDAPDHEIPAEPMRRWMPSG